MLLIFCKQKIRTKIKHQKRKTINIGLFYDLCFFFTIKYSKNSNADLEDALQYFCADKEGCEVIYTCDKNFPKIAIAVKNYD